MSKLIEIIDKNQIKQTLTTNYIFLVGDTDDVFLEYLANKIVKSFIPYGEWDLLYELEKAKNMFDAKLFEHSPNLIMQCKLDRAKFKMIDASGLLGVAEMDTTNNVGYSGFDSQNQNDTFEKSITSIKYKGQNALEYLTVLNDSFNLWAKGFVVEIINSMVKLIG